MSLILHIVLNNSEQLHLTQLSKGSDLSCGAVLIELKIRFIKGLWIPAPDRQHVTVNTYSPMRQNWRVLMNDQLMIISESTG